MTIYSLYIFDRYAPTFFFSNPERLRDLTLSTDIAHASTTMTGNEPTAPNPPYQEAASCPAYLAQ